MLFRKHLGQNIQDISLRGSPNAGVAFDCRPRCLGGVHPRAEPGAGRGSGTWPDTPSSGTRTVPCAGPSAPSASWTEGIVLVNPFIFELGRMLE